MVFLTTSFNTWGYCILTTVNNTLYLKVGPPLRILNDVIYNRREISQSSGKVNNIYFLFLLPWFCTVSSPFKS